MYDKQSKRIFLISVIINLWVYFIPWYPFTEKSWTWSYDGAFSILELVIGFPLMVLFISVFVAIAGGLISEFIRDIRDTFK